MNKHPLFIVGGTSGMFAALTLPVGAAETVSASTIQTSVIPVELLLFAIAATLGLICFGMMREGAQAIWIHALALLNAAFAFGCSFAFGRTAIFDHLTAYNLVITNNGVLIFTGGLLVFSLVMLIYSVMAEMHNTAEAA